MLVWCYELPYLTGKFLTFYMQKGVYYVEDEWCWPSGSVMEWSPEIRMMEKTWKPAQCQAADWVLASMRLLLDCPWYYFTLLRC